MVFSFITAAVIAEACSASPSPESIYIKAAEASGAKYSRLLGFVVAWWSTTAWTTFCASARLLISRMGIMLIRFGQYGWGCELHVSV